MIVVVISDTHCKHNLIELPNSSNIVGKKMIVHCGDCSSTGSKEEINDFLHWFSGLDYDYKVFVPGNHDFDIENFPKHYEKFCDELGIILLNDSGCYIEGYNLWGSPVQPAFFNWAFNRARSVSSSENYLDKHDYKKKPIEEHWNLIPSDTDILITHGPPYGILDEVNGRYVGCVKLREKIEEIRPKYVLFGHIHESRGWKYDDGITYCNASCLDGRYDVTNHYIVIRLPEKK